MLPKSQDSITIEKYTSKAYVCGVKQRGLSTETVKLKEPHFFKCECTKNFKI